MMSLIEAPSSASSLAVTSFGWSDFPCQESAWAMDYASLSPQTHCTAPWTPPHLSSSTLSNDASQLGTTMTKKPLPPHRATKVRLDETVHIRTFELIVGYHPLCRGGLAMQCGWNYHDQDTTVLNDDSSNQQAPQRLSVMERRQRLKAVTGCTSYQLLQQDIAASCQTNDDDDDDQESP